MCECGDVEWIRVEQCPSYFEGETKLWWREGEGMSMRVVPRGFSRDPVHCNGWFVSNLPSAPDLYKSEQN
jgi:hypothetical protein